MSTSSEFIPISSELFRSYMLFFRIIPKLYAFLPNYSEERAMPICGHRSLPNKLYFAHIGAENFI